ncbi:MAG TPA: hypothetical protein VKR06_36995 [Ktedonosporobacter sp.]|nr:hypothetical protein [Ktedonosporobacter sp.]
MNSDYKFKTAGVYVNVAGFFVFQVGLTSAGDKLGVVRLGGHREGDESAWECATREALESETHPG